MGLIDRIFGMLFGSGRNIVAETAGIFRENSEAGAQRMAELKQQVMTQFAAEFQHANRSGFDRFVDGLNRLPRPAMAMGTLGLFVAAMVNPIWFAERMQGIALVPEPLWWLMGAVVSFYFGARHQVKSQEFQKSLAETIARAPQVAESIKMLRNLRDDSPGVASTGPDAELAQTAIMPRNNPALEEWQKIQKSQTKKAS